MNDAEAAEQQARVEALTKRWQDTILADFWRITYVWHRGPYELEGSVVLGRIASTIADWRYCHATIQWDLCEVVALDDVVLEHTVVHELCHVLLNELRHGVDDASFGAERWITHEEHVVTLMALAFQRTRGTETA